MRATCLGNDQKNYPWHLTTLFSQTAPLRKRSDAESKYESQWHGMVLLSNKEERFRSPKDKERHGSTSRTIEPSLQDPLPAGPRKKLINPEISPFSSKKPTGRSGSRKKHEENGKILMKNSISPGNTLITHGIYEKYRERSLTPQPKIEKNMKKSCEKAKNDRFGNSLKEKLPPKPRKSVRRDLLSQICGLPASGKVEDEGVRGSCERMRSRQLVMTQQQEIRPGRRMSSNENQQWKSSLDIIKHYFNSKTFY